MKDKKTLFVIIYLWIRKTIKSKSLKYKVRRAEQLAQITGYKYYILYFDKKNRVISKKDVKKLIRKKYFKKGTTIEKIEKMAVYTTHKHLKK